MPDATGGIASGLYWVATGRLPLDELKPNGKDTGKDQRDQNQKGKKGNG